MGELSEKKQTGNHVRYFINHNFFLSPSFHSSRAFILFLSRSLFSQLILIRTIRAEVKRGNGKMCT